MSQKKNPQNTPEDKPKNEANSAHQNEPNSAPEHNSQDEYQEDQVGSVVAEDLSEKYAELQAQVSQYHDQLLRAQAEMENIRRRAQDDVAKARKFGTESFAESLIPVKDSLEAALAQQNQTLETFKEGVETTLRQLILAFERNHIKEIDPAKGDKFDPHMHQAISSIASGEIEANCVLDRLQKGYTIADRVLRPALVVVSTEK